MNQCTNNSRMATYDGNIIVEEIDSFEPSMIENNNHN